MSGAVSWGSRPTRRPGERPADGRWGRVLLYCSGGCAANAYHATGSVRGVYADGCDLFRKRMECAIAVAVARELGTE